MTATANKVDHIFLTTCPRLAPCFLNWPSKTGTATERAHRLGCKPLPPRPSSRGLYESLGIWQGNLSEKTGARPALRRADQSA